MTSARRIASLSVDLDDRWTYLQTRGVEFDPEAPGFLPLAVRRALELLSAFGLRATFLVVGRDAAKAELAPALAAIVAAGHEVANHTHDHLPWLSELGVERQSEQLVCAEEAILAATGVRPRGFRGPGHASSLALQRLLVERGYLYDASSLPTFVMPLVRRAYLRGLPLAAEARHLRRRLGGGFAAGFGSNRAAVRPVDGRALVEIPVTTLPLLRLPIHFTYLHLLAGRSRAAASLYVRSTLWALRLAGSEPSLLLHATDFLGREDGCGLDYFPGMATPVERKLELIEALLKPVAARFELGPLERHASAVAARAGADTAVRRAA